MFTKATSDINTARFSYMKSKENTVTQPLWAMNNYPNFQIKKKLNQLKKKRQRDQVN